MCIQTRLIPEHLHTVYADNVPSSIHSRVATSGLMMSLTHGRECSGSYCGQLVVGQLQCSIIALNVIHISLHLTFLSVRSASQTFYYNKVTTIR